MADDDHDKRNGESKANNWLWYLVLTAIILISIGVFAVNNAVTATQLSGFGEAAEGNEVQQRNECEAGRGVWGQSNDYFVRGS